MSDKKAKIKSGIIIAVSIIAIVLSVITLTKAVPTVMLKFADSGTVCDGRWC